MTQEDRVPIPAHPAWTRVVGGDTPYVEVFVNGPPPPAYRVVRDEWQDAGPEYDGRLVRRVLEVAAL